MKKLRGFTLIEAIIAMAIFTIITLGIYSTLQISNTIYLTQNVQLGVQEQVRNGLERISRVLRESNAVTITTESSSYDRISFTTPSTQTNFLFYVSGSNLIKEYPLGTATIIGTNISRLKFSKLGSIVNVELSSSNTIRNKTYALSLLKKIRLRNE